MPNFYKQIFFKFYISNLKSWKDPGPAAAQAFAAVLMYIAFNVFSLLQLSDSIAGTKFLAHIFDTDKLTYVGISAFLFIALWFSFIFNGRYKGVVEECENLYLKRTVGQKKQWELYFRIYEIGSIVLLILSVVTSPI